MPPATGTPDRTGPPKDVPMPTTRSRPDAATAEPASSRRFTLQTKAGDEVVVCLPAGLTEDESGALLPLLADPYDFIDDDRFYLPNAAKDIMQGDPVIEHPSTAWYGQLAYDPRKTPREMKATALPLLTPAEEKVIFLRFNFVRYQAEQIRGNINPRRFGVTKARKLLDYSPQTDISVGVPAFVEWYREYYGV